MLLDFVMILVLEFPKIINWLFIENEVTKVRVGKDSIFTALQSLLEIPQLNRLMWNKIKIRISSCCSFRILSLVYQQKRVIWRDNLEMYFPYKLFEESTDSSLERPALLCLLRNSSSSFPFSNLSAGFSAILWNR